MNPGSPKKVVLPCRLFRRTADIHTDVQNCRSAKLLRLRPVIRCHSAFPHEETQRASNCLHEACWSKHITDSSAASPNSSLTGSKAFKRKSGLMGRMVGVCVPSKWLGRVAGHSAKAQRPGGWGAWPRAIVWQHGFQVLI